MARRADYIIVANAYTEGAGATDIADSTTRAFMTLLGPRQLRFRHNVYMSCGDRYDCLEIFIFLPSQRKPSHPKSENLK